jgi:hypothetical protein
LIDDKTAKKRRSGSSVLEHLSAKTLKEQPKEEEALISSEEDNFTVVAPSKRLRRAADKIPKERKTNKSNFSKDDNTIENETDAEIEVEAEMSFDSNEKPSSQISDEMGASSNNSSSSSSSSSGRRSSRLSDSSAAKASARELRVQADRELEEEREQELRERKAARKAVPANDDVKATSKRKAGTSSSTPEVVEVEYVESVENGKASKGMKIGAVETGKSKKKGAATFFLTKVHRRVCVVLLTSGLRTVLRLIISIFRIDG